jgi:Ca2+-binding RTX toxin-like protein
MSQTRARLGRHSLVLAIAMLLVGAASANATTITFSGDGNTLIVTGGDNAAHEIQLRFNASTGPSGEDEIIDTQSITSFPAGCAYVVNPTWVSCAPHANLQVDLGAGNDFVTTAHSTMGDCFLVYTINLGDGANENDMNTGCTDVGATATINSGSGDDDLRGGSAGTSVTINAGGGADNVNGYFGPTIIHGGEGNDGVFGGSGNDQVFGEGGDDRLRGHEGNDLEDGGTGNDDIGYSPGINHDSDPGADVTVGGPGTDRLRLSGHNGGMTISIDGQANDGTPGEGDNVGGDIEKIEGTTGNDFFTGSAGPDNFEGDSGNDEIHGAGGNDDLYGGGGDDKVFGDAGDDKVQGANGADNVDGGPGVDQIYGDIGSCSVFCNFDADMLFARDGERDSVDCGGGADSAVVDQLDVVAFCASVDRSTVAPPPQAGGPAKANLAGSKKTVKVSRRGRFSYSFKAGAGLKGKAVFRKVATKSFTVPGSGKVTLKMRLSAKKLALLRRAGKIKTKVTVTLKDGAGGSSVASKALTLKR